MYKNTGFTLIELLVVVLIIGILASIALPQYQNAVEKSRATEGLTLVRSIAQANQVYFMETGAYTENIGDLVLGFAGEDVMETVPSKRFKNFTCRSRSAGTSAGALNIIALCRRNSGPSYGYYFYIDKFNPELIYCGTDAGADQKWCKLFTGKTGNPATF